MNPELLSNKITHDPEKEKKQENVRKLKKVLALKLWDHRMLELSQMPYDSSKVKFHDQLDAFFRAPESRPKDVGSPKAAKPRRKEPALKATEPVLSQCEMRMREN